MAENAILLEKVFETFLVRSHLIAVFSVAQQMCDFFSSKKYFFKNLFLKTVLMVFSGSFDMHFGYQLAF